MSTTGRPVAPRTGGQKEGSSKAPLSPDVGDGSRREGRGDGRGVASPIWRIWQKEGGSLWEKKKNGLGAGEASDGNGDGRSEIDRSRGEGWRGGEWGSEGAPGSGRRGGLGARARAGLRLRGGEGS